MTDTPAKKPAGDLDVDEVSYPPADKWDRLYRYAVILLILGGIAVGFYVKG